MQGNCEEGTEARRIYGKKYTHIERWKQNERQKGVAEYESQLNPCHEIRLKGVPMRKICAMRDDDKVCSSSVVLIETDRRFLKDNQEDYESGAKTNNK